jgi:pimeloyl-ACP methyl ester carboxylesterase
VLPPAHARLDTWLLARLCHGGHLRPLNLLRFKAATLTDPTAHGGRAQDAFDVVIPSMPGYGFSGKPTGTGWGPDHIARAWAELMKRLRYSRYVARGGDWGAPSPARWRDRRRQDCSASTSTCRQRYRPTWPRCSTVAGRARGTLAIATLFFICASGDRRALSSEIWIASYITGQAISIDGGQSACQ